MTGLKIAAVQTSPVFGEVAANIETALAMVPVGCDLVVLPELFATGYQFVTREEAFGFAEAPDDPDALTCRRLAETAADLDTTIVAGLAERDGDKVFNSSLLVRPDGSRELYRKVHLFGDEKNLFTPGDLGFPVFQACGTTVGMMICFDWAFPEAARSLALGGAQVIAHPSNLLLPWCPEAMKTRSLENRVASATANRIGTENRTGQSLTFNGMSQVLGPLGERLDALGTNEVGVALGEVDLSLTERQYTPQNHLFNDRRPDAYRL